MTQPIAQNTMIEIHGVTTGDGKVFWDSYWTLRKEYEPRGLRWASDYDARRPRLVQVFDSFQADGEEREHGCSERPAHQNGCRVMFLVTVVPFTENV